MRHVKGWPVNSCYPAVTPDSQSPERRWDARGSLMHVFQVMKVQPASRACRRRDLNLPGSGSCLRRAGRSRRKQDQSHPLSPAE